MPFQKQSIWHFYCVHYMSSIASNNKTCRIQETRPGCRQRFDGSLEEKKAICFLCQIFSINFISAENDMTNFAFFNIEVKVTGTKYTMLEAKKE